MTGFFKAVLCAALGHRWSEWRHSYLGPFARTQWETRTCHRCGVTVRRVRKPTR